MMDCDPDVVFCLLTYPFVKQEGEGKENCRPIVCFVGDRLHQLLCQHERC